MRGGALLPVFVLLCPACGLLPGGGKPVARQAGQMKADSSPQAPPTQPIAQRKTEDLPEPQPIVIAPVPAGSSESTKAAQAVFEEILKSGGDSGPVAITVREGTAGVLQWTGRLDKGDVLTIEGDLPSEGVLKGRLPGVPVVINIDRREFAIVESPNASNRWSRIAVQPLTRGYTILTIPWRTAQ